MGRVSLVCALLSMTSIAYAQPAPAPPQRTIFKIIANVRAADFERPGEVTIALWDSVSLFAVSSPRRDEIEALSAVLDAADRSNRAAVITFDAASGRVDPSAGRLVFAICTASLDEISFNSRHHCREGARSSRSTRWQHSLAMAVAEAEAGNFEIGRTLLDTVLAAKDLPSPARTIALQARVSALMSIGESASFASPAADQAHFAALKDSRALVALDPDNKEPAIQAALLLGYLGDDGGAAIAFREIIKRWPENTANLGVSLAVVIRQKGDFEQSLSQLNDVAANHGDELGMRYYYHRGWTLLMLDRFDEAIEAFNNGMETQADYPWAFIRRGCAEASVGRLAKASDDFDQGMMLLNRFAPNAPSSSFTDNLAQLMAIKRKLASASGRATPMLNLCNGFSGLGDQSRAKSKLLD